MTIYKEGEKIKLNLTIAERRKPEYIAKSIVLDDYNGNIIFRVFSKHDAYSYFYSLDKGKTFTELETTVNDLILCYGYTGAYVGVYATSNGNPTKEYADFDWVFYKGYMRH